LQLNQPNARRLNVSVVATTMIGRARRSAPAALVLIACCISAAVGKPADDVPAPSPHVAIEALADYEAIGPGQTFWLAVVEHIEPGWHTYWTNPGDAGQPTSLHWTVPEGFRVDAVQWPVPQVFRSGPLVSYGYEDEVVLLQQMHAPMTLAPTTATLSVEARWLVCREVCIPEHAQARLIVHPVAAGADIPSARAAALFRGARARLPTPSPWPVSVVVHASTAELTLHGLARDLPGEVSVQYLPLSWGQIDYAARQKRQRAGPDLTLVLSRGDTAGTPMAGLDGLVVLGPGAGPWAGRGFGVRAVVEAASTRSP
jgi:DsbC/DsbD-like thiol-disulfide interchange protein